MDGFAKWLTDQNHSDPGLARLAQLVSGNAGAWAAVSTEGDAAQLIDSDTSLSVQDKTQLFMAIGKAWDRFSSPVDQVLQMTKWQRFVATIAENALSVFMLIMLLFFIVVLILALFGGFLTSGSGGKDGFLTTISDITVTRGLITFLFGIATVAVSILLVIAAFTSSGPDIKERFDMGKQVLATLIGVFGTIVGFYFGVEIGEPTQPIDNGLQEEEVVQAAESPDVEQGATDTEAAAGQTGDQRVLQGNGADQPAEVEQPATQ